MATIVETLGKELEQIDQDYSAEFAGQSRLTRDLGSLDRLIARTQSVIERVEKLPAAARGPDLVQMLDAAKENVNLYSTERAAIARAQAVGPVFEQFSVEAASANFVFARYGRHFAGKDRSTRDVALLGELVEDLRQIDKRMSQIIAEDRSGTGDFERDRETVRQSLAQYQKEIELVEKTQTSGTPEERASILAALANNQFGVYQQHFAGEPRVSRRPALLMRVVSSLKKIKDAMTTLREGGLDVEFNAKNITIVAERLSVYESELTEIRKIRQSTPMTDLMGELGGAANKLFDEYRAHFDGKPRGQADEVKLGIICDKLGEIRRQMTEMSFAEDNEMNRRNLEIVSQQLGMFEGEFEAVVRAKAAGR